jgi:mannose-6-phosphate isomerase class I
MNPTAALSHHIRLQNLPKLITTCVTLQTERLLRLQTCAQTITVTAGCAYISWNGEDYLLRAGQQMLLRGSKFPALISAAGEQPLHFEIITQA